MPDDSLANYFKKRANRTETKPADRLMDLLRKVQTEEKPTRLRHMPPDPTATRHPDGDKPDPPKPKKKRYPKVTV